jgi:hypothetical protein
LLRDAVATIDLAGASSVRSFPVRDADTQAMMVAHVVPIRLSARDIFVRCAAALVLTPVTLPRAPPADLVQSLFDLTPAEARVARDLSSGETVEGIASARGSLAKYNPRTCSRRFGKNRLQPPSRHRRASHRDFRDAADEPDLTRHPLSRFWKSRAATETQMSLELRAIMVCDFSEVAR